MEKIKLALNKEETDARNQAAKNSGNPGPLAPAPETPTEKGLGEQLGDHYKKKGLNYLDKKVDKGIAEAFAKPNSANPGPLASTEIATAAPTATATTAQTAGLQALAPATGGLSPGASIAVTGNAGMAGTTGATLAGGGGATLAGGGGAAVGGGLFASVAPALLGVAAVDQLFNKGKMRKSIFNASSGGEVTPEYYNQGTPQIDMQPETLPYTIEQGKTVKPRGDITMPYTIPEGTAKDPRNMNTEIIPDTTNANDPRLILRNLIEEEKAKAGMGGMPKQKPFNLSQMSPANVGMVSKGNIPYGGNNLGPLG